MDVFTCSSRFQKDSVKLFLLLFLVFTLFAHTIGENENSRLNTSAAIVENNSLAMGDLHTNTEDKVRIRGDYYTDKPPLSSFAAVPGYFIVDMYFDRPIQNDLYLEGESQRSQDPKLEWARFVATVSVESVAGAVTGVLLYAIFLHLGVQRRNAVFLAVLSGFGTLIFPYSTTFHGVMLGTMFMILSVYLWIRSDYNPSKKEFFLISVFVGLSVSAAYETVISGSLLLTIISIKKLKSYDRHFIGILGLILGLFPLLFFNTVVVGNPIEPTMLHSSHNWGDDMTDEAQLIRNATEAENEGATESFLESPVFFNMELVAGRILRALVLPSSGLFLYMPLALVSIYSLKFLKSYNEELYWFISLSFVGTLIFSSFIPLWTLRGYFGPRYLITATVLLMLPLAVSFRFSKIRLATVLSGILSVLIMFSSTRSWKGYGGEELAEKMFISFNYESISDLVKDDVKNSNWLMDYLYSLSNEGLQSPILSYLMRGSENFHMVLTEYADFKMFLGDFGGFIFSYDIRFFLVTAIFLFSLFAFRNFLCGFRDRIVYLIYLLPIVVFILGFSISSSHSEGWYTHLPNEEFVFGQEDPKLHFMTDQGDKVLILDATVYGDEVDIKFNGVVKEKNFSGGQHMSVVELNQGLNSLKFETPECKPMGFYTNNDDYRCITLGLRNFNVLEPGKGVHIPNSDDSEHHIIPENKSFVISEEGNYSLEADIYSEEKQELELSKNDEKVASTFAKKTPSRLKTSYIDIEGSEVIDIARYCSECGDVYIKNVRLEEFGENKKNKYKLGSGWYEKVESEERVWGGENLDVYLYNDKEEEKSKKIELDLISFHEDRNVSYILNGDLIENRETSATPDVNRENFGKHSVDVDLEPGENVLNLESDKCIFKSEINDNDDYRCASLGLKNLDIIE